MKVSFQREQLTKQSQQVFYKCREPSKRRNDKSLHTRQNLGLLLIYDGNFRKGSIFLLAPSSLNSENMKQAIGYSLFVLSFITWGAIAVVPFLDVSIEMATAYTTGLVIIGEIAFFLSMVLLGKEFLLKIKNFWVKLNVFQKQQD